MATAPTPAPRVADTVELQKLLLLLAADWLNNDRTHATEIAQILADIVATLDPPVNRDIPYASQAGATLTCTMGNWEGEPTGYAYEWHTDGVANGATGATHGVTEAEAGQGWACVVVATNALGSTRAPMSNTVIVT